MNKDTDIVEEYANADKSVIKYVHANGGETTIKTVSGCVDGEGIEDKNKVVMFLSSSIGCKGSCQFCYLTGKAYPYAKLSEDDIATMGIAAVIAAKDIVKGKYLKISFMGMGDAFYEDFSVNAVAMRIFTYVSDYIRGIDGVDVGTMFPKMDTRNKLKDLVRLNSAIWKMTQQGKLLNPNNEYTPLSRGAKAPNERTAVRLFVSLHSMSDPVRHLLMPGTEKIFTMLMRLHEGGEFPLDVIFHYMLLDVINDSDNDLVTLYSVFETLLTKYELRLLRFNECPNIIGWQASSDARYDEFCDRLKNSNFKFKYQVSTGAEILAACGQFVCKKFKK